MKSVAIFATLVLLIVVHDAACAAVSKSKDESNNDLSLSGPLKFIDMIPLIGPLIIDVLETVKSLFSSMDSLTNGLMTSILGGTLPCTISISTINCTAAGDNGGAYGVIDDIVNLVPDSILPNVPRAILLGILHVIVNPMAKLITSGISI